MIDSTLTWIRERGFPRYYNPLATMWRNRVEPFTRGHPVPSIEVAQNWMRQASKASKVETSARKCAAVKLDIEVTRMKRWETIMENRMKDTRCDGDNVLLARMAASNLVIWA